MQNFSRGAQDVLDGFKLIQSPQLRLYVLIPLLINILVFVAVITGLGSYFADLIDYLMSWLPEWEWLAFLRGLMWIIFGFLALLLVAYTFVFFATLIGSPFYGLLAEQVDKQLSGRSDDEPTSWGKVFASVPHALGRELAKLWYYLPRALGLFLLCLIPLISAFAPILWGLFSSWTMALEFLDYPADNNKQSIAQLKVFMRRNRHRTLGFGLVSWGCTLVPILNLFAIPAAVAGGVKFWLEAEGRLTSQQSQLPQT